MAYSKTFLLVGLLFAVVLIMSSKVSARELAETAQTRKINLFRLSSHHIHSGKRCINVRSFIYMSRFAQKQFFGRRIPNDLFS